MRKGRISVSSILFGLVMLLLGVVIALLSFSSTTAGGTLLQSIGFAFIVTGVVVVFQEWVIAPSREVETQGRFDSLHKRIGELDTKVAGCFKHFEEAYGTKALALRLVTLQRAGYDSYHHWLVHTTPEDLFFAGHSVLHRVQIDMDRRGLGKLDQAIVTKLLAGSNVRILFLDPTWDFVKTIAEGEGQTYERMLTDLTVTLGICRKILMELEKHEPAVVTGSIDIRMCKEVQQYAFHSVTNRESGTTNMLVGLYFANSLGMNSPLFSVEHKDIQDIFTTHFVAIANRQTSTSLLEYSPPIKHFNDDLYEHCRAKLVRCGVPQRVVDQYCPE